MHPTVLPAVVASVVFGGHAAGAVSSISGPGSGTVAALPPAEGVVPRQDRAHAASATESARQAGADPLPIVFSDAASEAGVVFRHRHGGGGERYMIETMGSGVAVVDLDGDGWLDIYLVQSAATPGVSLPLQPRNRAFRNRGDGTFVDVTAMTGTGDHGYGMGVAAADYDDDGLTDLLVTNYGANRLYRSNGDGTFSDVTEYAGVGDESWGTSAAWADVDGDGDLDLYVTNYVDFAFDNHKFCGNARRDLRAYCHPDVYNGVSDLLYRNDGDGTFTDVSAVAGIDNAVEGKGLGVAFADFDDDGDVDIYVANDSTRNFLYMNQGDGTFVDDALLAGAGYSEDGKAEAGMGTDQGDYDGDGRPDVVVTNLDLETNTLYRNVDGASFVDATFASGLGEPSLLSVGFGANWLDADNDGDLDLFVANGHIIDNIAEFKDNVGYEQPNHLYRNDGNGTFKEIHAEAGTGFSMIKVSRGSAIGDLDNDGDLDLVVSNNDQAADYLRNDTESGGNHWIQLRLAGIRANRHGIGAHVVVEPGGGAPEPILQLVRETGAGSSYCSTSAPTLHVGIGPALAAQVTVRWPGGVSERLGELAADRYYVVREGLGIVASRPAQH